MPVGFMAPLWLAGAEVLGGAAGPLEHAASPTASTARAQMRCV
jgi:hypothetical protein